MNRTFTELTTVLMMTALCALPLAGQEKVAVEMEPAVCESVQLRADDAEALPDSAIQYSPNGEKQFKFIYTDENKGTYKWKNNTWEFESSVDSTYFIDASKDNHNVYHEFYRNVSYEIKGEYLYLYYPLYNYIYYPATIDFETEYDVHGNLTAFKIPWDGGILEEITFSYNTENNPVSMERRQPMYDLPLSKWHYEYNDDGYHTRIDGYKWDRENEIWVHYYWEALEYDTQGRVLSWEYYNSEYEWFIWRYEYYDEHPLSSGSDKYKYPLSSFSSVVLDEAGSVTASLRREFRYGATGKLEAIYHYSADELFTYYILYPNTLDNSGNAAEPVDGTHIWSSAGTLHVRTAQPAVLHVYTPAGALHAQQTLPAGETVLPLPPGIYIVKVGNATEKIVIGK
jgi:hypothetical protein